MMDFFLLMSFQIKKSLPAIFLSKTLEMNAEKACAWILGLSAFLMICWTSLLSTNTVIHLMGPSKDHFIRVQDDLHTIQKTQDWSHDRLAQQLRVLKDLLKEGTNVIIANESASEITPEKEENLSRMDFLPAFTLGMTASTLLAIVMVYAFRIPAIKQLEWDYAAKLAIQKAAFYEALKTYDHDSLLIAGYTQWDCWEDVEYVKKHVTSNQWQNLRPEIMPELLAALRDAEKTKKTSEWLKKWTSADSVAFVKAWYVANGVPSSVLSIPGLRFVCHARPDQEIPEELEVADEEEEEEEEGKKEESEVERVVVSHLEHSILEHNLDDMLNY